MADSSSTSRIFRGRSRSAERSSGGGRTWARAHTRPPPPRPPSGRAGGADNDIDLLEKIGDFTKLDGSSTEFGCQRHRAFEGTIGHKNSSRLTAEEVFHEYTQKHPNAIKNLGRLVGYELGESEAEMMAFLALIPALGIMLLVLAFNLLGNGLRDVMDVKRSR